MYPTDHPTTALVLAHYRNQEDIARAEAYRAARAARAYRRARGAAPTSRTAGRPRAVWLYAALRSALGRT